MGLQVFIADIYVPFYHSISLPYVLLRTILTLYLEASSITALSTYFAKYGSHNSMMFMGFSVVLGSSYSN
jgi:hypothetical protein